jgi:rare lipoprotein A
VKYPVERTVDGSYVEEGIASYYAEEFNGRKTSNGEIYDMNTLTAAHQTLPFNTRVRVTNLDNGKSVIVRINDRGPFKDQRIIDLSLEAARSIGMIGPGTARVRIEVVGSEGNE